MGWGGEANRPGLGWCRAVPSVSGPDLVLGLLVATAAVLGYALSDADRRKLGRTPWGLPPPVWALIWFLRWFVGLPLYLFAHRAEVRRAAQGPTPTFDAYWQVAPVLPTSSSAAPRPPPHPRPGSPTQLAATTTAGGPAPSGRRTCPPTARSWSTRTPTSGSAPNEPDRRPSPVQGESVRSGDGPAGDRAGGEGSAVAAAMHHPVDHRRGCSERRRGGDRPDRLCSSLQAPNLTDGGGHSDPARGFRHSRDRLILGIDDEHFTNRDVGQAHRAVLGSDGAIGLPTHLLEDGASGSDGSSGRH